MITKATRSCYEEEITSIQRTQTTKMRHYKFMYQIMITILMLMTLLILQIVTLIPITRIKIMVIKIMRRDKYWEQVNLLKKRKKTTVMVKI